MKNYLLSNLLAATFCVSARAGLYTFNFSDSGLVPQGGTTFSVEQPISSITDIANPTITQVELILTFNDNYSLLGNSSGIQGSLNLGTGTGSPFVSFYPSETSSSGGQYTYDVTFSGLNGLNPNATWGLVLWDNSTSGLQNELSGWSLNITAVPEPINLALGVFGVVMLGMGGVRHFLKERKSTSN